MTLLSAVCDALVGQQYNPVAFLRKMQCYPHRLWWPAWGIRAGTLIALLVLMTILAWVTCADWRTLVAPVLLLPLITQMLCAPAISILGEAQFWFLYAYSPPLLFIAWLGGLGALWPAGTWLGIQVGFVFYVGRLFSDSCTLWVHQQMEEAHHEQQRRRGEYLSAVPVAMTAWLRARKIRLWAAPILSSLIFYMYYALPAQILWGYRTFGEEIRLWHALISIGAGLAGCLGFDATLLALLKAIPPVSLSADHWQATYVGRVAMWTPMRYTRCAFSLEPSLSDQSRIICTLFTQGYLGPVIRQAFRTLPTQHLQQPLMALSVQEGGGAILRYLRPALPLSMQPIGTLYANLADEATKPPDLQRWLHVLTAQFPAITTPNDSFTTSVILTLTQVRDALLSVKTAPELTQAIQHMHQFIAQLRTTTLLSETTQMLSWPSMLLWHLEQHQKRLQKT
jgi:hypothetical protein